MMEKGLIGSATIPNSTASGDKTYTSWAEAVALKNSPKSNTLRNTQKIDAMRGAGEHRSESYELCTMSEERRPQRSRARFSACSRMQIEMLRGIQETPSDFLARVEDIERVEKLFYLLKKTVHRCPEHLLHVRRADEPIVLFAADGTAEGKHEVVDLVRELVDHCAHACFLWVDERNDMEIAVAHMPRKRVEKVVAGKYLLELRQEYGEALRRNHEGVDERRRAHPPHLLAQEVKALAPHDPVLARRLLALCQAHADVGIGLADIASQALSTRKRLFLRHPAELGHEDKLGYAAGHKHE